MADPKDRVLSVINSTTFNGIDFVEVVAPRTLHVHFLNTVAVADASLTATITGGDSVPTVPLRGDRQCATGRTDAEGRPLLTLHALTDGDFSYYTLTIIAPAARPDPRRQHVLLQGDLPERLRLRAAAACLPTGRHAGAADRLPGEGFPQLPTGAD